MRIAVVFAAALTACTTLGPMPSTIAVSPIPAGRPGGEVSLGAVPAFYLSQSAQNKVGANPIGTAGALFEPDRWIHLPGLFVGGRLYGASYDTVAEPYIGYRHKVDNFSFAGVFYGTGERSAHRLASYHATRFGLEAIADVPVWSPASWFAMHVQASIAATRIDATGTYCVDTADGHAIDCDESATPTNNFVTGSIGSIFPAGTLTFGLDFGRRGTSVFHGSRVAIMGSTGQMPLIKNGMQTGTGFYGMVGLMMSVGLGAP
jgi:hypothetical protein